MDSRKVLMDTINHKKTERILIDFLADQLIIGKLMSFWDLTTEVELLDMLKCDLYYLSGRDISQNETLIKCYKGNKVKISENDRICPLGIKWTRGAYESKYNVDEAIRGPLTNISTSKDILDFEWPKPEDFDFSLLQEECEKHDKRIKVGGLWTGIMGDSYRMHGFQNFLLNIALNPEIIKTLIDRMTEMYMELNNKYFDQLNGKFDIWFFGNDFGSQGGLIMSPEMWYEFFFENIKSMVSLAKSYGLRVMHHSCGAIVPIISYLAEAGIEILDPIQVTAKDMQPELLSERFGDKIVFHGGIDTQNILPKGTREEVVCHVDKLVSILNSKNGYIFAPSQILANDIPIENIILMYEQISQINKEKMKEFISTKKISILQN